MDFFSYESGTFTCEGVSLEDVAGAHGTPAYVYSEKTVTDHYRKLDQALAPVAHRICYSVKTNSNLMVLSHMASLHSGFDIVSGGELFRVLKAGGERVRDPSQHEFEPFQPLVTSGLQRGDIGMNPEFPGRHGRRAQQRTPRGPK